MSESVVLCEGYHDRAFWTGWLEHAGCKNLGRPREGSHRIRVFDPWNNQVTAGEFAFHSATGRFIRIVPCHGKDNIIPAAESRLKDRGIKELTRLVLAVDADVERDAAESVKGVLDDRAVEALLGRVGKPEQNEYGEYLLDDGRTVVSAVRWQAVDDPGPGVPSFQTLERLVCAALVAAYPDRGPAVQHWLDARPNAPSAGPKEFAWSHMAGWYAEYACEAFFRRLWRDATVAGEFEARLRACGAWRIVETLAE